MAELVHYDSQRKLVVFKTVLAKCFLDTASVDASNHSQFQLLENALRILYVENCMHFTVV
jgi:hypothetical protein